MVVVDDKGDLDGAPTPSHPDAVPIVPPPPYQLHPGAAPPFRQPAIFTTAAVASTSSLNSYGASTSAAGSGSGSGAPLRHTHSFGEVEFDPYDLVQPNHRPRTRGHTLAASYSHPPPPPPPRAQTDPHAAYRHSFPHPYPQPPSHLHFTPAAPRPMSPRRQSPSPHPQSPQHLQAPHPHSPLSPMSPTTRPPSRPQAERRHSGSPRQSLFGPQQRQPPPTPPMTPAALAQEEGRRYHEQMLAKCAAGDHTATYNYGPVGIISSVLMFPVGLICLFIDRERRCARCGERLDGRRLQRAPPGRS